MMALFKPNVEKLKAKRNVEGLIKALSYEKDPDVREDAASALGEIGNSKAVEPLIKALEDSGNVVRRYAAEALGKIGDKRAVEPLIKALKDSHYKVCNNAADSDYRMRDSAAEALGKIGDKRAFELLIRTHLRVSSCLPASLLEKISNEETVELLIKALEDMDCVVRWSAAETLGEIGDKRAVEPLIKVLGDEDWLVRKNAAEALGKIGDARAIEPLINTLGDSKENVRRDSEKALKEIGSEKAVEPLIKALMDGNEFARCNAASILGEIRDKRAVEPLIKALKDSEESVRHEAASALGEIGDKSAFEALIDVLKKNAGERDYDKIETNIKVFKALLGIQKKEQVIDRLCNIGSPIVECLIRMMDEHQSMDYLHPDVRDSRNIAMKIIKKIGEPAVPLLINALNDDVSVEEAASLLGKISDPRAMDSLIEKLWECGTWQETTNIAAALLKIDQVRAIEPLMEYYRHTQKNFSEETDLPVTTKYEAYLEFRSIFEEISDPSAVKLLKKFLDDEDENVRRVIREALTERRKSKYRR